MAKYQQYDEYKDSGVEWLGEIPNSWQTGSLRWMIDIASGESLPSNCEKEYSKENQFPVVGGNGVMGFSNKVNTADAAIAVGRVGALCGNIHSIDYDSWITDNALKISKWNKFSKDFLVYLLKTAHLNDLASKTAQPLITGEQVKSLKVVLLPIAEQKKIANFLDHETGQIDSLIEKQQTLIQLLKEKRQAVISHAVTKGLNPDALMKDSGVEWLGEVPEHWEVKKNKHLLEFVTSGSRGWAGYYSDEGKLFFRITNLTRDTIEPKLESIQNVMPPLGAEGERSKIQLDDLLISITADLGSVCVANNSISGGFVSQHVSLCRPNSSVKSARWLAYFILSDSAKEQFVGSGYGGTKIQLSLEDIRELNIAYPPKKEQEDIASYIDVKLKKFELLMSQAEQAIQLMQERRTALISAAVTGKIDVRGWVAPK